MNKIKKQLEQWKSSNLSYWMKQKKWKITFLVFMQIVLNVLAIVVSLMNKGIVDSAIDRNIRYVFYFALLIVLIFVTQTVLMAFLNNMMQTDRAKFNQEMRTEISEALLRKKYEDINRYHSGELMQRIFSDAGIVANGVFDLIPNLAGMLTSLISATTIFVYISWQFTLCLIGSGVAIMVSAVVVKRKIKQIHKEAQEQEGKVRSFFQEFLGNIKLIKASSTETYIQSKSNIRQDNLFSVLMKRKKLTVFVQCGMGVIFRGCWLVTLLWGCMQIVNGAITYGTLLALMQLIGYIQSPFSQFSSLVQQYYSMSASSERIWELLSLTDEKVSDEVSIDTDFYNSRMKAIKLNKVTFSYDRDTVLSEVSCLINKGDIVAVTGLSGGGKSTLFLLLLGIYEAVSGKITLIGKENKTAVSSNTRKLFAYVPQGNTLFSGSIRENVCMFRPKATEDEIEKVLKIACIEDFVKELPNGLDTYIGERGLGLSEGQAQRIAIARGVLSKSPILLLDESTSALDEETEALVLQNFSKLKDRTCLIVTHRKATLKICNKQLIIKDGKATCVNLK